MNINYEIPDDLHRALKVRAAEWDMTLKALITKYLMEGVGGQYAVDQSGDQVGFIPTEENDG